MNSRHLTEVGIVLMDWLQKKKQNTQIKATIKHKTSHFKKALMWL